MYPRQAVTRRNQTNKKAANQTYIFFFFLNFILFKRTLANDNSNSDINSNSNNINKHTTIVIILLLLLLLITMIVMIIITKTKDIRWPGRHPGEIKQHKKKQQTKHTNI